MPGVGPFSGTPLLPIVEFVEKEPAPPIFEGPHPVLKLAFVEPDNSVVVGVDVGFPVTVRDVAVNVVERAVLAVEVLLVDHEVPIAPLAYEPSDVERRELVTGPEEGIVVMFDDEVALARTVNALKLLLLSKRHDQPLDVHVKPVPRPELLFQQAAGEPIPKYPAHDFCPS